MIRRLLVLIAVIITGIDSPASSTGNVGAIDADAMLRRLDGELEYRDKNIANRQHRLDSLLARLDSGAVDVDDFRVIGRLATGFDNNLALSIFGRGLRYADSVADSRASAEFQLRALSLLPLAGVSTEAVEMYEAIDTTGFDTGLMRLYYDSGRKMYGYIATIYAGYDELRQHYDSLSVNLLGKCVALNNDSRRVPLTERLVSEGEHLYYTGNHNKARLCLLQVLDSASVSDNSYAIAAHLLALIAADFGNENELIYYLALSALADTHAATREVTSLQRLGQLMLNRDDISRAHAYLSKAMQNATEAHVVPRMIQTAAVLPLIEQVHQRELALSRRRIYALIAVMAVLIILLAAALIAVHRRSVFRRKLQEHLEASNLTKEIYISRFLDLCAVYMDKLNQFCKVASNKISTGQVDELYRLTRSGKFVEHNSSDFYEIFDAAFLHMYPDFVEKVNKLLRDDSQIYLREGEKLNTDLRILAFMRLGIEDTARVGRILNYSVNTIYAYRNKLRNRAIDRDNFETAIAAI